MDQLSLTQPNSAFAERATQLLEQAGYAVDYYPSEEVTVEFYRHPPSWSHDLIILRAHSALGNTNGRPADWVTLFTSESFDNARYLQDLAKDRLSRVRYYPDGPRYFGIMPAFIKSSMIGKFQDATVIVMGCEGLTSESLAEAFVQRGAKAIVAWDGPVSSAHTDAATERLLQHLLIDELPIREAAAQTMTEVGPDPQDDSRLVVYPPEG